MSGPTIRLVHGNHALNTVYVTEDRSDEFLSNMAQHLGAKAGDVVCFGHTHKAFHRAVNSIHFVNTGTVGRPKDGDPRAGYVLLDVGESVVQVEFVRVDYDVETAIRVAVNDLFDRRRASDADNSLFSGLNHSEFGIALNCFADHLLVAIFENVERHRRAWQKHHLERKQRQKRLGHLYIMWHSQKGVR